MKRSSEIIDGNSSHTKKRTRRKLRVLPGSGSAHPAVSAPPREAAASSLPGTPQIHDCFDVFSLFRTGVNEDETHGAAKHPPPTARDNNFCIDEEDYRVLDELLSLSGVRDDESKAACVPKMVRIDETDFRVWKLVPGSGTTVLPPSIGRLTHLLDLNLFWCAPSLSVLPEEIGNLTHLTNLSGNAAMTGLPNSIGRLKNLRELNLATTRHLTQLPDELGSLKGLRKLYLGTSGIASLPPSIGNLKNLEYLNLDYAANLRHLPHELGNCERLVYLNLSGSGIAGLPNSLEQLPRLQTLDLSRTKHLLRLPKNIGGLKGLEFLNLSDSKIRSLPPSIGNLASLVGLDLSSTRDLSELPSEFGRNLKRLEVLNLHNSRIRSLPASVGHLKSIREIHLAHTKHLTRLPEEIGNLKTLKKLDLYYSGLRSLPESIRRLKGLLWLDLDGTRLPELAGQNDKCLLALARDCPLLGFLGEETEDDREAVWFALACNRFRSRCVSGILRANPRLWPLVIKNATVAFDTYPYQETEINYHTERGVAGPDAIYQLLQDCNESFAEVSCVGRQSSNAHGCGFPNGIEEEP